MNTVVIILILIIIYEIYLIYSKKQYTISGNVSIRSKFDGLIYKVNPNYHEIDKAVEILSDINQMNIDVIRALKKNQPLQQVNINFGPYDDESMRIKATNNIIKRYNPDNLFENSPHDPTGDTSYTFNKGTILAFCIRNKHYGDIQDINILKFVALHELAHIGVDETDHTENFWFLFKYLLYVAEINGIYQSPDFAKNPVTYCNGMKIAVNPLKNS